MKIHFPLAFLRQDRPGSRVPTQLRSVSVEKKLFRSWERGEDAQKGVLDFLREPGGTETPPRGNGTGQDSSTNGRYSPVTKGNHHRSGGTGSSSRHKLSESRRYFAGEFRRERVAAGWPTLFLLFSLSLSLPRHDLKDPRP